jgi:hypothetical protein
MSKRSCIFEADIPRKWLTTTRDDGEIHVRRQDLVFDSLYAHHAPETVIQPAKRLGGWTYLLGSTVEETKSNRSKALAAFQASRRPDSDDILSNDSPRPPLKSHRREGTVALANAIPKEPCVDVSVQTEKDATETFVPQVDEPIATPEVQIVVEEIVPTEVLAMVEEAIPTEVLEMQPIADNEVFEEYEDDDNFMADTMKFVKVVYNVATGIIRVSRFISSFIDES